VSKDGEKCIIADLAMKGRDRFIAGTGQGNTMTIRLDKTFSPAKEIEEDLRILQAETGVGRSQIVADSDGLGQYLESYIKGIKEFHGNAKATDPKYANLRSQCYYKLSEMVNNRSIRVICSDEQQERIKDELGVIRSMFIDDPEKKLRIISKDTMKELLGHSPDYADMLMMWMVRMIQNSVRVFDKAEFVESLPDGQLLYGLKIGSQAEPYALCVTSIGESLVADCLIYRPFESIRDFTNELLKVKKDYMRIICHASGSQQIADLAALGLDGITFLPCKEFKDADAWRCDVLKRNSIKFVNRDEIQQEVEGFYYESIDGRVTSTPKDPELYPFIQSLGCSVQYETSLR
jgi:hypothetical protein